MTSSDHIVVDYSALTAAESELARAQRQIAAALEGLNTELAPLLATWEGIGRDAYLVQQRTWNTAAADLNVTLAAVHQAVGAANAGYQQTDQRIAQAWQSL